MSAVTGPKTIFLLLENSRTVESGWTYLQQSAINILQTLSPSDQVIVALVRKKEKKNKKKEEKAKKEHKLSKQSK